MPTVHTWQYLEYIVEGEGDDQYITIYGYDSAENPEHPHVHIPAEIEHEGTDLPVKRIGVSDPDPETMEGAPFATEGLESVNIEEGPEIIGVVAFGGSNIAEINLPDSIITVENNAFEAAGLVKVNTNKVETIQQESFRSNDIEEAYIGSSMEGQTLGEAAFRFNNIRRYSCRIPWVVWLLRRIDYEDSFSQIHR